MTSITSALRTYVNGTVGIWPLVTFRVLFGLIAAFGAARFGLEGWVETLLVDTSYKFSFWGFGWVPRPGAPGAYALYGLIFASALAVALGWRFRWSAGAFVASFAYAELLDATHYLNHYYLVVLLGSLLALTPAAGAMSLDVGAGRTAARARVPAWCVHAIMLQLGLVYVFAGVAKVNADWLLRAMPLAVWLPEHAGWPLVGPLLAAPATAYLASWAACVYDLTIVGWLLWPRTRRYAYAAVVVFHGATWAMFNIGLFPLIMTAGTTVFFAAETHRRFWRKLHQLLASGKALDPTLGADARLNVANGSASGAYWALIPFFLLQFALPLRSLAYPGRTDWTEEGYRFGWRVMLVEKVGHARLTLVDAATRRRVEIDNRDYLSDYQIKQMAIQPDFVLQYAQHLAASFERRRGWTSPEVYADVWVSLNGRRARRLIDPTTDLAAVSDGLSPKPWILPLDE